MSLRARLIPNAHSSAYNSSKPTQEGDFANETRIKVDEGTPQTAAKLLEQEGSWWTRSGGEEGMYPIGLYVIREHSCFCTPSAQVSEVQVRCSSSAKEILLPHHSHGAVSRYLRPVRTPGVQVHRCDQGAISSQSALESSATYPGAELRSRRGKTLATLLVAGQRMCASRPAALVHAY